MKQHNWISAVILAFLAIRTQAQAPVSPFTNAGQQFLNGNVTVNSATAGENQKRPATGNVMAQQDGTFTNTQLNFTNQFLLNSPDVSTDWQAFFGSSIFNTAGVLAAMAVPSSSTVNIATAGLDLIDTSSSMIGNAAVGRLSMSLCKVSNSNCYGGNQVAQDTEGNTGDLVTGDEVDVNLNGTAQTRATGIYINGQFSSAPVGAYAIQIANAIAANQWNIGVLCRDGAMVGPCLQVGATSTGNNVGSQELAFVGRLFPKRPACLAIANVNAATNQPARIR